MKHAAKWIWFAEKCGVGNTDLMTVFEKFGSIKDVYLADYDEYIERGIGERLAETLSDKSLDGAYSIMKYCEITGVGILTYSDETYPKSLRSLKDPPAVLYYVGELPDFNKHLCIATVGTRKMSEYGMRSAYKIAYETAASGAVVISGMALGIDAVAASAAMAAGGKTVAVLGCGIDVIYPREHKRLYNAIKEKGAILTEYPPSTEPRGFNFPQRNRIISGLSQGTVVIDAGENSGALITAKTAILQGRDVYAVPSNIDSENSSGTNSLIRDGAQAVLCGNDIVKNYVYLFRDTLDVQRMKASEARSDFDASVLSRFGIRARGGVPAFEGISAKAEKENGQHSEVKEKTRENKNRGARAPVSEPLAPREEHRGDDSMAALQSLDEKQRRIFDEMPLDRAISLDHLLKTGFKLGEIMSALTKLEIKGLISSLPGGLYTRK